MSTNQTMERFMRSAQGLPSTTPETRHEGADARSLARDLYVEFVSDLKLYEKRRAPDLKLAAGGELTMEDILEADIATPADRVSFGLLQNLAHHRPECALAKWEEVRAAAREELASGWHASRSIFGDAWERACFLAIREQFHEMWPPRNGVELMLLDEMSQYETLRRKLLREVTEKGWNDSVKEGKRFMGSPAILQAIDRLQRLGQYALRSLLGLRRVPLPQVLQRSTTVKTEVIE